MTVKAWLVSSKQQAVVCDGPRPFVADFPKKQLSHLPPDSYLYLPTHLTKNLPIQAMVAIDDQSEYPAGSLIPYRLLIQTLDLSYAHAISYGLQWFNFATTHLFCHRCAHPLQGSATDYGRHCSHCHHRHYPPISPCVISAVTTQNNTKLLLARHHRHKNGMFGLIAGFVEIGESAEQAVAREVFEETALVVGDIRYITSQPYPYPSNLMLGFFASHQQGTLRTDPSELAEADFFDKNNLPPIPPKGTIAHHLIMHALKIGQ